MLDPQVDSKLPHVGTTIFTEMSAMAQRFNALNMSQGFPDFQPPHSLQTAVSRAMASGHNQYAPMAGNIALREWIAKDIETRTGAVFHPGDELTVGAGASSLIFAAIQALVGPGDEVMVLTPCYDLYEPAIALAGGTVIAVPLKSEGFHLDLEAISRAWTPKIRMLIVNIPNNPTGATWNRQELAGLADLVQDSNAFVLSDEVYGPMHYDGKEALSIAHEPRLHNRSIIAASFGKVLHCTGWKIGYVTATETISREIRKVHQYDVFSTGAPLQAGIVEFLSSEEGKEHMATLAHFYATKRDRLVEGLKGSRWSLRPAEGGYFQILDYGSFDDRQDRAVTTAWCQQPEGLALIPLSPFFPSEQEKAANRSVRICFAKNDDTLDLGIERLLNISES